VSEGHFIDGASRASVSGETFDVTAPYDGRLVGRAARGGMEEVAYAVTAARRAFVSWASTAAGDRERALLRAADAVEAHADGKEGLVDLLVDESGSTLAKARGEIAYAAQLLRAAAGEARRLYGDTMPNDRGDRLSLVLREPLGVVAVISPFNAPVALLAKMVAFPLAAGNTVVVKPSEETPLVAVAFARICHAAGLPSGVLNVVTGLGRDAGEPLVAHPGVRGIAFTGSTATGIAILQRAATTMKRVQLELGGKNPLLVLRDVDPEEAAKTALAGAFAHAGQICMAASRIVVERAIAPAFTAAMVRGAEAMHLGDLRDPRTAYGPLISDASVKKVQQHVDEAVAAGASILTGGSVHHRRVYRPTLLAGVPRTCAAWREETFGPVASIVEVSDLDEAIAAANDSAYGLSAGVLTSDVKRAFAAARRIRCGSVHIGAHAFHSNALAPIGGYGMSGIGRSGGKYSVDAFTELKWVSLDAGPEEAR
jgi:acyl-CoA reductase-like NAD-dependent aldehyde dehydrogenase